MNSSTNCKQDVRSVVLVDDEPSVLNALKLLLGVLGFEVQEFINPQDALQHLKDGARCDLVLCDLRMPKLDGIGLLRALREFLPKLPFVLISGHATDEDVEKAKQFGVTAFLGKPFTANELNELIAGIAHGSEKAREAS